jgi:hypothetical protein
MLSYARKYFFGFSFLFEMLIKAQVEEKIYIYFFLQVLAVEIIKKKIVKNLTDYFVLLRSVGNLKVKTRPNICTLI